MRPGSNVVARFEINDFADEPDDLFQFAEVLRDGVWAAHLGILFKAF